MIEPALAVQFTAVFVVPVTIAEKDCMPPVSRLTLEGDTLTAMIGWMVTAAEADLVGSATLVAVTVTVAGVGTAAGAVYTPVVAFTVTTVEFPFSSPFTVQVTAVFAVPVTVGVKVCVAPTNTLAVVGEMDTTTAGRIAVVVEPEKPAGLTVVAVIVTVAGLGTAAGAVNSPVLLMVPALAVQVTLVFAVPVTVVVNCCCWLTMTLVPDGLTVTAGSGAMVIAALADFVGSAALVPVTVIVAGLGTTAGAVYSPVPEIVPLLEPPTTVQLTPRLDVPVMLALNCNVPLVNTVAVLGETLMVTGGADMVAVAVPNFVGSAWLVAVMVTVAGLGTLAGAVKRPPVVIEPALAVQFTAVFVVPVTVALNDCVPLVSRLTLEGDTLTAITARMVTEALKDLVGSATLVAVTVTVAGLGTVAGAV